MQANNKEKSHAIVHLLAFFTQLKKGLIVILCENMIESLTLNVTFCLNLYGEDGVPKRMESPVQ